MFSAYCLALCSEFVVLVVLSSTSFSQIGFNLLFCFTFGLGELCGVDD